MTSIRIDDQEESKGAPTQQTMMYALPLNATSAINVQLLFQQQHQQQLIQQQGFDGYAQPSASTYVRSIPTQQAAQFQTVQAHTIAINTDDTTDTNSAVYGVGLQSPGSNSINSFTANASSINNFQQREPDTTSRSVLVSVESEPDSARGSIPDDTGSIRSSGSRGTTESLTEDLSRGITKLNVGIPNDSGIMTSPIINNEQVDFKFVRMHSMTSSNGSQSSFESPTSPLSPRTDGRNDRRQQQLSLTWDEEEQRSGAAWNNKFTDASSFILDDFTDEETRAAEDAEALKATRVALLKGEEITAMIKVKCSTEQMGSDLRVVSLLQDILSRCDQLGQKMKGCAVRLTPFHLNKMKLQDGRPAKERAAEVARTLGGDFILCEAVCQKHADRLHICTELKDVVYEKGFFSMGKIGIMVTLWKKHKYAVAKEFSDPLCDHIYFYRPNLLGSSSDSTSKRKRKATDTVRRVMQSPALLSQMFKTDPTITVAEAARRSFVDIIFYALYE